MDRVQCRSMRRAPLMLLTIARIGGDWLGEVPALVNAQLVKLLGLGGIGQAMREPIACERSHQGLEIVARTQMLELHWRCIHQLRAAKSALRKWWEPLHQIVGQ